MTATRRAHQAHGKPKKSSVASGKASHKTAAKKSGEPPFQSEPAARSYSSVYTLYDRGINARLSGDNNQAVRCLLEASKSYPATRALTMEAEICYELGQAAESEGNLSLAADSYTQCLKIKPSFVDASIKLSAMLLRAGDPAAALARAREAVSANPFDARSHTLLAEVLEKNGFPDHAKREEELAGRLLRTPGAAGLVKEIKESTLKPAEPSASQSPSEPGSPAGTPDTGVPGGSATDSARQSESLPPSQPAEMTEPGQAVDLLKAAPSTSAAGSGELTEPREPARPVSH